MKFLFTGLLMCSLFTVNAQPSFRFLEEYIDFRVTGQRFSVNGIYTFSNASDRSVRQQIRFPFPMPADSVHIRRIFHLEEARQMVYRSDSSGVVFELSVAAHDTISINIAYDQPLVKKNIYILTTTASWHQPLKKARYALEIDDPGRLNGFSWPPDSTGNVIYFWRKKDFNPEKNFIVWLKKGLTKQKKDDS